MQDSNSHSLIERQADLVDEANLVAAAFTDNAVAAARQACQPQQHPDFDGKTCLSCGDDIPAERLAMGRIRCVACQSALEQRGRRG